MDNNNFTQPQPNPMQPNQMPQNPMQSGPMQPQMPYPNGQYPYPPQQYPPYPNQPMMKPPKQPMDPAKKKKIILIVSICSGVLVLGIAAAIVIPILLRVDYSSAYIAAKEVKPKIYDIYRSYDCEYVVDYVDSTYTTSKEYAEYIEDCKAVYNSDTNDLISKLENTDGVKRNEEIKTEFNKFKAEYDALTSGNSDTLEAKLSLWQAYHDFNYSVSNLKYNSATDAELTTAANYLINSGNDTFKTYAEGWLEHNLAVAALARAYEKNTATYSEYNNKRNEFRDWNAANKPDINSVAPLSLDNTSKMYSAFTKFYDLLTSTYEKNYNFGSNDCDELFGEVYCE